MFDVIKPLSNRMSHFLMGNAVQHSTMGITAEAMWLLSQPHCSYITEQVPVDVLLFMGLYHHKAHIIASQKL
jgi:hypothetical protein